MEKRQDRYSSFAELSKNEKFGTDFRINLRYGFSGITVMALHGGDIEPGTSEIASAVASFEHSFYEFEGLKAGGNRDLHIKSTRFDEPLGLSVAAQSETIVAIHGCKGREESVYIGGLCTSLREEVGSCLSEVGFVVGEYPGLTGKNCFNLCNRSLSGAGVQLELTSGLRRIMFHDLTREGRKNSTKIFDMFTAALRNALFNFGMRIAKSVFERG